MRALLVGVSEYPSLGQNFQLEGPRNDIARMRDILSRRGFQSANVTVLADGVTSAELPTRANILRALERLAKTATKDDTVLLYFAGHGSQQPADRTTEEGRAETDGLFEIFLPRDIGQWSGARGSVENALIKTELRAAVDRIRATGAFVWGVFDACHSATLVRGASPDVRMRYVNPAQLGIPQAALDDAARDGSRMRGAPVTGSIQPMSPELAGNRTGDGNSVFFYAAQTRETTPEMRLPLGHADGRQYGLFGYMVMEALETGTPMTYRQMAQYVLARYGAMNETRVTPLFSGTALDQPVLGQQVPVVRQWAIEPGMPLTVRAGALAGLANGATLAVLADPLAPTDKALGYMRLTEVSLAMARAEPVAYRGKPALQPATLPKSAYARAVQALPDYALRVSVDARDCGTACAGSATVKYLRAKTDAVPGTVLTWVDAPAQGDVMLKLLPDRIVLLPPSLQGAPCDTGADGNVCPQSATLLATPDAKTNLDRKLATALHAVARSTNLLRLAARLSEIAQPASRLEVTLRRASAEGTVDVAPEQVPTLRPGDRLAVAMRNNGFTPVDVTMLYLDARYGINTLFPDGAGASNRLEPNASHAFEIEITDETLGMERLLTIAVDASRGQERADFSFLAQPSLAQTRGTAAGVGDAAANDDVLAFMDAGFASYRTRAARPAPQAPSARTSMHVYTFQIAR